MLERLNASEDALKITFWSNFLVNFEALHFVMMDLIKYWPK